MWPPISIRSADRARPAAVLASAGLGGCDQGPQSAFDAAGLEAYRIADLTWILFAGGTAIFILTMALLAAALWLPARRRRNLATDGFVVWLGIAFPVATLSALLAYGLTATGAFVVPDRERPDIRVAGELWWWRVEYLDDNGNVAFASANEVRLPAGERVDIALESDNVIHSFWIPALGGKLDMIPGRTNVLTLSPDRAGVYRGQCVEYCGRQHALMAFDVVVLPPDEYEDWRDAQQGPAETPRLPFFREGQANFDEAGCGACHTVRGTEADGTIGPDLTHIGSRRSIAAGTLPNNIGTLAAWISDSQHLKPGNAMPSFDMLEGPELRSIAAYLESLE